MPNFFGGAGNDSFAGDATNETIYGGAGEDTLYGGSGLDTIYGDDGNDRIDGGDGNDTMYGGSGNDTFFGNFGLNEAFYGGAGNDLYQIAGTVVTNFGYSVNLETGLDQFGKVFSSIETVVGGNGADTITGRNDTSESLDGGGGADIIYGNDGNDTLLGDVGADTLYGGAGNDLLYGGADANSVFGGDGNDVIIAGTGNERLEGGLGADTFVINAGNGVDTIVGGTGSDGTGDVIDLSSLTQNVTATFTNATDGTFNNGTTTSTFSQIERMIFGSGADTINGAAATAGLNLVTNGGADSITAGSGSDFIDAGAGNDSVVFGAGDDTVYGGDGDDVIDDAGGMPVLVGNNLIYGGAGNDLAWDASGNDTYYGGAGNDSLWGDSAGDDRYFGEDGNDSIFGGAGNDQLFGGIGNDTVSGGTGADRIDGGDGGDVLTGGTGADVFVPNGADTITDFDATTGISANGNLDNDFVDLRSFYNATTLAAWNAANPGNQYDNALKWLQGDQADGILQSAGGLRIQNGGVAVSGTLLNSENTAVCFAAGTRLATAKGHRPIEKLRVGDLVETADHGLQPIRWIGSMTVDGMGEQAPILISAGALGNRRDILVSPLHRMLVSGWRVELLFGEDEVIAAAKLLVDGAAIRPHRVASVSYYHILFDAHEIVFAEGAGAESFHPGEEGFDALGAGAQEQITALFPQIAGGNFAAYGPSARRNLRAHEARLLHMGRKMEDTGQMQTAPHKKAVAAR